MRRVRVIPVLTIDRDRRLVKTIGFGKRSYIGDPINAVRIFNTKMVDELILLDIDATTDGRGPAFEVGSEMPLWGFTAGVIARLFERLGWEKPWDDSITRPLPELL